MSNDYIKQCGCVHCRASRPPRITIKPPKQPRSSPGQRSLRLVWDDGQMLAGAANQKHLAPLKPRDKKVESGGDEQRRPPDSM